MAVDLVDLESMFAYFDFYSLKFHLQVVFLLNGFFQYTNCLSSCQAKKRQRLEKQKDHLILDI